MMQKRNEQKDCNHKIGRTVVVKGGTWRVLMKSEHVLLCNDEWNEHARHITFVPVSAVRTLTYLLLL